jgi:hypothetical protein
MIDPSKHDLVWRQYLAERARQRCAAVADACERRLVLEGEAQAAHQRLGELMPLLASLGDDPHLGQAWDILLALTRGYVDAQALMDLQVEAMQAAIDDALLGAWPLLAGHGAEIYAAATVGDNDREGNP